jgi:DNA-binding transcriptional LysR family regulator
LIHKQKGVFGLNFHNIEYFLAIAEELNISKAATRLHISQQSLSEQLKKIEDEVGATLVRRGRTISLTAEGEIFKKTGFQLLHTYEDMLKEIASVSHVDKTTITLAIPNTESPQFLPGLLSEFSLEYPEYKVKIISCQPKEAAKCAEQFDLYFSALPLSKELDHISILDCGSYAVSFTPDLVNHIYGERWPEVERQLIESRSLAVLKDLPFILLQNQLGEVVLDQQIIFHEAGFAPNVTFQSSSGELNSNMCTLGSGAYVSTMDHANHRFHSGVDNHNDILIYPVDSSITPVLVALSHRKGKGLSKAERCFVETAKSYLQNYI